MTVKRFVSIFFLLAVSLMSFAQVPSLKGTWEDVNKELGVEYVVAYEFGSDTEGPVLAKAMVSMNINLLGLRANGSITMTFAGTFSYNGATLTLTWNKESIVISSTPITVRYKDEDAPEEIREKFEKPLRDLTESMKTMLDVSTYQCTVTKDRLTLSRVNSEGKTVSTKYRRIINQ